MQNPTIKSNGGSEIQTIKDDLSCLKDDTVTLARDIKGKGGRVARDGIDQLMTAGEDQFHRVEERVKERPGQSMLLAFAAGLFASYVLRPRR